MKLDGFLSDQDVNTIKLTKGNMILEYEDCNAGTNKAVKIDRRYIHTNGDSIKRDVFLKLEGEGNVNYKLNEDSLEAAGGIVGDILPRPLTIKFYSMAKEYDGTPDFTKEYLRYKFCGTGEKQSGLVMGTDYTYPYTKIEKIEIDKSIEDNLHLGSGVYELSGFEPRPNHSGEIKNPQIIKDKLNDYEMICRTSFPVCVNRQDKTFHLVANESTAAISYGSTIIWNDESHHYSMHIDDHIIDEVAKPLPFTLNKLESYVEGQPIKVEMTEKFYIDNLNSNTPQGNQFVRSDVGRVLVDATKAVAPSKNVCDLTPLTFHDVELVDGINDSTCKYNYTIENVYGYGLIFKRSTHIHIIGKSKIYDGTNTLEYELSSIDRKIEGDELSLNAEMTLWAWEGKDISSKPRQSTCTIFNHCLIGKDSGNYNVYDVILDNKDDICISPRDITISLDTLRIYPSTSKFEIRYELYNTLSLDEVYIDLDSAIVVLPDGTEIEGVFVSNNLISSSVVRWYDTTNVVEIGGHDVKDTDLISIKNIKIKGKDSSNYNLTTTELNRIPIRIMHIH